MPWLVRRSCHKMHCASAEHVGAWSEPRLHIRHAGHCAGPDAPLPCARGRSRHASALLRAGVVTKGGLRPSRPLSVHPRAARLAARVPPASRGPRRLCRLLRPGRPLSRGQRRRRGFHWRYLWGTAAAGVAPYAMRRPRTRERAERGRAVCKCVFGYFLSLVSRPPSLGVSEYKR